MSETELLQRMRRLFISRILRKEVWASIEIIEVWQDCLFQVLKNKLQGKEDDEHS